MAAAAGIRSSFSATAKVTIGVFSGSMPAARTAWAKGSAESPTTELRITSGLAIAIRVARSSTSVLPNGRYSSPTSSASSPAIWSAAIALTQCGQM